MARYADGYAHGGGPPRAFERAAASARAAWSDLGRPGRPRLWGQGYFALGDADAGAAYLRDYYAFTGPFAERIAAGNLTSARAIKDFVRGYAEAGCDELILFPSVADRGPARPAGGGARVKVRIVGAGPAGPVAGDPAGEVRRRA